MGFFGDVKQAVSELIEDGSTGGNEDFTEADENICENVDDKVIEAEKADDEAAADMTVDDLKFDFDELKMLDDALAAGFEQKAVQQPEESGSEKENAISEDPMNLQQFLEETMSEDFDKQNTAQSQEYDVQVPDRIEKGRENAAEVPKYNVQESENSEQNSENNVQSPKHAEQDQKNIMQEPVKNNTVRPEIKGVKRRMENSERVISDETSVITPGMTVTGSIEAEGSLSILGTVKGNVNVSGKLEVTGHINGDLNAHEFFAENARITGNVVSETSVKVGAGTVIVGNIDANSAAIAGAIKGDIDVHGPVIIDSGAIVMGNIKSKTVQINNGAAVEGNCSQCYAEKNPTAFFDDYDNQ